MEGGGQVKGFGTLERREYWLLSLAKRNSSLIKVVEQVAQGMMVRPGLAREGREPEGVKAKWGRGGGR